MLKLSVILFALFTLTQASAQRFDKGICNGSDKYLSSWSPISHQSDISTEGSMGRANMVYVDDVHDSTLNTVYIGTDYSGLWKTSNFQNETPTWRCVTCDARLPGLGVVDIAINPNDENEILLATGIGPNFLLEYGLGVIRSTNGGKSWKTTNLSFDSKGNMIPAFRVKYQPGNPTMVIALSRNEIYRSTDGGQTFDQVFEHPKRNKAYRRPFFNDLVFDPQKPNCVYATTENGESTALQDGGGRLIVSTDNGVSWQDITCELPGACNDHGDTKYDRVDLSITSGDRGSLAVLAVGGSVGKTLFLCNDPAATPRVWKGIGLPRLQASWWMADLQHSLENPEVLYVAHVRPQEIDLRTEEQKTIISYQLRYNQHIDLRDWDCALLPNGTEQLFVAHDGGVAVGIRDKNGIIQWQNKNGTGLNITQFFGLGYSSELGYVGGGTQDLGFIYHQQKDDSLKGAFSTSGWKRDHVGDGYDSEVDVARKLVYVGNNLSLRKYEVLPDRLRSRRNAFEIGRDQKAEVARNGTVFYAAFASGNGGYSGDQTQRDVIDEDKDGNTSEYIKGNLVLFHYPDEKDRNDHFVANRPPEIDRTGHRMSALGLAPSDTQVLYVGTDKRSGNQAHRLYRVEYPTSPDANWIDLSEKLLIPKKLAPKFRSQGITDIQVDPANPNAIWVSYKHNFGQGQSKVIYHPDVTDSLKEWRSVEAGLDQFPVNKLALDIQTGYLYAGTDIGVFVNTQPKNPNSIWECFNKELPIVKVTDIEIDYCSDQLVAATFGRGIWACALIRPTGQSIKIERDTVITGDYVFGKSLELSPGVRLEINGDLVSVDMTPSIVLNPGSQFIVKGNFTMNCMQGASLNDAIPTVFKIVEGTFGQRLVRSRARYSIASQN